MLSLQQRILDVLEEHGSVAAKAMPNWLKDVDHIALDCGLNALMRANKVSLTLGRYDLVRRPLKTVEAADSNKPKQAAEAIPEPIPTAEQEAAASLQPATIVCKTCKAPRPECEFRAIGSAGKRSEECNTCHGKKVTAGQSKHRGQAAEPNGEKPPPIITDRVVEQVRGDLQADINKRAVLQVDLQNLESRIAERNQFLEMYQRYAQGAA